MTMSQTMKIDPTLVAQARAAVAAANQASVRPQTITELIDRYLDHCKSYYLKAGKPTAQIDCVSAATHRLRAMAGDEPITAMDVPTLEACRELCVLQGTCRTTTNRSGKLIVQMFRWAATREHCDPGLPQALANLPPLKAGRTKAPEREPVKPAPTVPLKQTLRTLKRAWQGKLTTADGLHALKLWTMVVLQLRTGMRPGEVCDLTWRAIDLDFDPWRYKPAGHKTAHHGIEGVVFIGPDAQRALLNWQAYAGTDPIFAMKRNSYRQALQRWLTRHGIDTFHPHQLRHNFATVIDRLLEGPAGGDVSLSA